MRRPAPRCSGVLSLVSRCSSLYYFSMSLKRTKTYKSFSSKETEALGEKLAEDFLKTKAAAGALVLALKGELGAGKTTFTQGLFRGLGIKRRAQSPTFIIMRRHRVPS